MSISEVTVSKELEKSEVYGALPARLFLKGDAVACRSKNLPATDGHQFTPFVFTRHVVKHSCIIYEGIQLPVSSKEVMHVS